LFQKRLRLKNVIDFNAKRLCIIITLGSIFLIFERGEQKKNYESYIVYGHNNLYLFLSFAVIVFSWFSTLWSCVADSSAVQITDLRINDLEDKIFELAEKKITSFWQMKLEKHIFLWCHITGYDWSSVLWIWVCTR